MHRARFLGELRNPTGEYWRESELMMGQPPLGSYLMGLGLTLQGRDLDTNGFYNFHFGQDWNRRHGNMPDELDLAAARRTNSVVGALIAASVYLIARGLLEPGGRHRRRRAADPAPLVDLSLQPRRIGRAGDAPRRLGDAGGDGAGESPDLAARHPARACCSVSAAPPS